MMVALAILITIFELYNLRKYGIDSAINKAQTVSELVKNGLTSHMVNGNMHQRDVFLNSISKVSQIEQLWVVRSDAVNEQFGKPKTTELPHDNIDQEVLTNGKMKYQLNEEMTKTTLRVTIPYNAISDGSINCINCHNVKHGSTLGAVSLVLDISDVKRIGLDLIYLIVAVTFFGIVSMMFLMNKILNPYLEVFEKVSSSIAKASNGIFETLNINGKLSKEADSLLENYNLLTKQLNETFGNIESKLKGFIGFGNKQSSQNPLEEASLIITNLSYLYQFKKEIEHDKTKADIYHRLAQVLKNHFHCDKFSLIEIDKIKDKREIVYLEGENFCVFGGGEHGESCRTARTKADVSSSAFHNVCPNFANEKGFYYCISVDTGKTTSLVINFIAKDEMQLDFIKEQIPFIKSYINEAAPSIEVKLLMQALQDSAFRDGLTGMYNRKFLDEHLKKLVPHMKRDGKTIGVLMLDMDHFKNVNDEYGHQVGDLVLKELARILSDNLRESDVVVRYGGEEFVVLLVGANDEDSSKIAEKLRQKVYENEIEIYAGTKLKKTVSIGLAMFPEDSSNIDLVMKNADMALYEAKNNGRNRVVKFTQEHASKIDLF